MARQICKCGMKMRKYCEFVAEKVDELWPLKLIKRYTEHSMGS